jgi:regulator of protease activity HflC (stomatin/prohibitin superfamily)
MSGRLSMLAPIAAGAVSLVIVAYVVSRFFQLITVWEYEKGLRYVKGKFQGLVGPGRYWVLKLSTKIDRIDTRPQFLIITGQEVLSQDSIALKVSLAANHQVIDPVKAVMSTWDYTQALYTMIQVAVRDVIGSQPIDQLLENRKSFDEQLLQKCVDQAAELGIKLISVNVRDIMFPGDLKKVFAQVVQARKEGLAALERARGETAALRNLANAAKLLENNPMLLQLRMLQTLGESSGNTVMLGVPQGDALLSPRAKKAPEPAIKTGPETEEGDGYQF